MRYEHGLAMLPADLHMENAPMILRPVYRPVEEETEADSE